MFSLCVFCGASCSKLFYICEQDIEGNIYLNYKGRPSGTIMRFAPSLIMGLDENVDEVLVSSVFFSDWLPPVLNMQHSTHERGFESEAYYVSCIRKRRSFSMMCTSVTYISRSQPISLYLLSSFHHHIFFTFPYSLQSPCPFVNRFSTLPADSYRAVDLIEGGVSHICPVGGRCLIKVVLKNGMRDKLNDYCIDGFAINHYTSLLNE